MYRNIAVANYYWIVTYIDSDNFKTAEGHYPKFEFTWQEENPESMKKICPKLFDKLWDKK